MGEINGLQVVVTASKVVRAISYFYYIGFYLFKHTFF